MRSCCNRLNGCPTCAPSPWPDLCETCWRRDEGACDGEPDTDDTCPRTRELEAEAAQDEHDRRQEAARNRAWERGW